MQVACQRSRRAKLDQRVNWADLRWLAKHGFAPVLAFRHSGPARDGPWLVRGGAAAVHRFVSKRRSVPSVCATAVTVGQRRNGAASPGIWGAQAAPSRRASGRNHLLASWTLFAACAACGQDAARALAAHFKCMNYLDKFEPSALQVVISDLLVATCDHTDPLVDGSITRLLRQLRDAMGMDMVFVSEFVDGRRVFRHVDAFEPDSGPQVGDGDPLELSYCKQVLDGRMPGLVTDVQALPQFSTLPKVDIRVGAHLSTPVTLEDGTVFGTLCCFSTRPNPALAQQDLVNLQRAATLVARKLDLSATGGGVPRWVAEPA